MRPMTCCRLASMILLVSCSASEPDSAADATTTTTTAGTSTSRATSQPTTACHRLARGLLAAHAPGLLATACAEVVSAR
jgi:hypothetical protein